MSWLFSQALVAEFSAATCSDGARSALSSGTPTPQAFLPPDRMTDFSRPSRFGMTFGPLTDDLGAELLTWFLEGFPARTSQSPERERASTASDPACGPKWRASLAKYDPATCSWKTAQLSLLEDSGESSVTWPRWGTTVAGALYLLPTLVPRTDANESGLWQTPVADDAVDRAKGKWNSRGEPKLSAQVMVWPTPTVCGNYNRKGASATSGDGLYTVVLQRQWPTPTVQDAKNNGAPSQMERNTKPLNAEVGGALNPTWVEWLMGWPLGWTDLQPLATAKSLSVPRLRGVA